ncbi:hypothetical protein Ddye_014355 [Dipteronia dyeriana]|uniref:Reverse transcriptase zinc-binding domain-containing protein n=1 Tax=Dipteronia dyeriana TaxID=168575 RepID=A0AAD9X7Y4_9ROSI|nr:hypothetical protein Ddye_014355 [Dipteronia dyeriana]
MVWVCLIVSLLWQVGLVGNGRVLIFDKYPKSILDGEEFHVDLCDGLEPNREDICNMGKSGLRVKLHGKKAKKVQLMMNKGILKTSLVRNWIESQCHKEMKYSVVMASAIEEISGTRRDEGESRGCGSRKILIKEKAAFKPVIKECGLNTELPRNCLSQDQLEAVVSDVDGNLVAWDSEAEIAKVLEIGVALSVSSKEDVVIDVDRNNVVWNTEKEIDKVLQTGFALGIDFGNNAEETKLKSFDNKIICDIGWKFLNKRIGVDVVGFSSGLISLWNEDRFVVTDCITDNRCIFLVGELLALKKIVGFCNVYEGSMDEERRILWEDIAKTLNSFTLPWVEGGDFNVVPDASGKIGMSFNRVASLFKEGSRSESIIKEGICVVVGDGSKIRFWEVSYSESITLRESFPTNFTLSKVKDRVIRDFGDWDGSSWSWNIPLRRLVFGWEHQQWCCFCSFIQNIKVRPNFVDALAWSFNLSGSFSVESFRKAWEERIEVNQSLVSFCWQGISPSKLEIFVWQLLNNKVFNDIEAISSLALDLIQFRVAWWFKHHGCGYSNPITSFMQCVSEHCKDTVKLKKSRVQAWVPPRMKALMVWLEVNPVRLGLVGF